MAELNESRALIKARARVDRVKAEARVLGVDDGPFTWEDARVPVVGVVMRGGRYVEGVLVTDVEVDGSDATERLLPRLAGSRFARDLSAILLDGVALGGFNVVNVARLHAESGVPVITVTRGVPDFEAMRRALERHHEDWRVKWALVEAARGRAIPTEGAPITIGATGLSHEEAVAVVARATVRGRTPEPLRLAHLIATAVVRGESAGQ